MNYDKHKECIDACMNCQSLCYRCASEDIREEHDMAACIQFNLECAAICGAAALLLSVGSAQAVAVCKICAEICRKCESECGRYVYAHCRECAEACHKCAELCSKM